MQIRFINYNISGFYNKNEVKTRQNLPSIKKKKLTESGIIDRIWSLDEILNRDKELLTHSNRPSYYLDLL